MLMLINLEDGIPPGLVPVVPLDSLDEHGESEIVSVIFDLIKPSPEEAAAEIEKLRRTADRGSDLAQVAGTSGHRYGCPSAGN